MSIQNLAVASATSVNFFGQEFDLHLLLLMTATGTPVWGHEALLEGELLAAASFCKLSRKEDQDDSALFFESRQINKFLNKEDYLLQ